MHRTPLAILLVLALPGSGCAPMAGEGLDVVAADPVLDATSDGEDATCPPLAVPDDWSYPPGPYGTEVGDRIADFALDDCDGRPVRFGDLLGSGRAVLVVVAAGWCSSCVKEARTLETAIHQAYCSRGVRTLQVLFEDATGNPAGGTFCRDWRSSFGLTFPVVVDPSFLVRPWFGGSVNGQTPLNLLVDREGVIRYRSVGPIPADLERRIDGLVP